MSDLKSRVLAATGHEPAEEEPAVQAVAEREEQLPDLAANDPVMRWLGQYEGHFRRALPAHVEPAHFVSVAWDAMQKLRNCTPQSIGAALLACARFGLLPDGKHAAIVPYGQTATFVPMYEGYIDLMYRSGRVDSVHFGWIRQNDRWDYEPSAPPPGDFMHRPRVELSKDARGPIILAYAFAWIRGARSQVVLLNREDAEEIRNEHSRSFQTAERKQRYDSAWHTNFDAMWAKSCLRRLDKVVPSSPDMLALMRAEDAADAGLPPVDALRVDRQEPERREADEHGTVTAEDGDASEDVGGDA